MVYTVYYFIYGVKLTETFVRLYEEHLEKDWSNSLTELIHQFYQGDFYIGEILWSTEHCKWSQDTPCTSVPVAVVSPESKLNCIKKVESLKISLPDHIAREIAEPDFYWCSGTS